LFVAAAIRRMMGAEPAVRPPLKARLVSGWQHQGDRPTYHPAVITESSTGWQAAIVPWKGSSDLRATAAANGMVAFVAGAQSLRAGDVVPAYRWG
jgi:molybdopterin biosynthesis enzyme